MLDESGQNQADGSDRIHVPPAAIPRNQWAWRKNYRVWEANRKVFLYPENYLYPDPRDDKTPFFEEGFEELQQQEVSDESAENAYKNYFDKFLSVANMKYAGAGYERPLGQGPLYLFAHTLEDPPQYHFRTLTSVAKNRKGVWSPWQRIDLAINASVVSPFVYQGKLDVFWVDIKSQMINEIVEGTSFLHGYKHSIDLHFSHLKHTGQWRPETRVRMRDVLEEVKETLPGSGRFNSREFDVFGNSIPEKLVDSHTLTGYQWDRIYPHAIQGHLRFYYRDSIDLELNAVPASSQHAIRSSTERSFKKTNHWLLLTNSWP